MTWRIDLRHGGAALGLLLFGCLAGCSGCDDDDRTLKVVSPAPDQELSLEDDVDEDEEGLQFDVEVDADGLVDGTPLRLVVGGERVATGELELGGHLTFPAVTLPPGAQPIHVQTVTGTVTSDRDQLYIYRKLEITSPAPGVIDGNDDTDLEAPGIQVTVTVAAYAIGDDEVALRVDGDEQATGTAEEGEVNFERFTLDPGEHTLVAVSSGGVESEPVEVMVEEDQCGALSLLSPQPDGDNQVVLGGADDSCPESGPFTTTVEIATEAPDGTTARLYVNSAMAASTTVEDGRATFVDVAFDRRDEANTLSIEIDTDPLCQREFPVEVIVDCDGPSCLITAPTPYAVTDGDTTLEYLNLSHGDGTFEFRVASSADGQEVVLIIDGEDGDPPTEPAMADGPDTLAVFSDVALADGMHTIRARCTDAEGNRTDSGEESWIVDTAACAVSITSPAGDTTVDDENLDLAGVQTTLTAEIMGEACDQGRAASCDPGEGIMGPDFGTLPGSSVQVTFPNPEEEELVSATLCLEVRDPAGNVTLAEVDVSYDPTPPEDEVDLTVNVPADTADYRAELVDLAWRLPTNFDFAFTRYDFRCYRDPLVAEDDEEARTLWWNRANHHLRANGQSRFTATGPAPDARTGTYDMPTGAAAVHCAMRACDDGANCTDIPSRSDVIHKPFREVLVDGPAATADLGARIEPVGDVNGDGLSDALIAAAAGGVDVETTGAYLIFGRDLSAESPATAPDVAITRTAEAESNQPLGHAIAGLGDINGDGLADFAISAPTAEGNAGVVFVFLGRQSGDPWPGAVDLSGPGCGADMCIRMDDSSLFGSGLAGVGDFDGTPPNDIAVGASGAGAGFEGSVVVLLGQAGALACEDAACSARPGEFWEENRTVSPAGSADFNGFLITHSAAGAFFGERVFAAGKVGGAGDPADDLLAINSTAPRSLYLITGRAHSGTPGLDAVAFGSVPVVLSPIDTRWRFAMAGDLWDPPGVASAVGLPDLVVHESFENGVFVYAGDGAQPGGFNVNVANRLRIHGPDNNPQGESLCSGQVPALGWVGGNGLDMDLDGIPDMCMGSDATGREGEETLYPGGAYYVTGDVLLRLTSTIGAGDYDNSESAYMVHAGAPGFLVKPAPVGSVTPAGTASEEPTNTALRTVQHVGDLTGDGQPDLLVGDLPRRFDADGTPIEEPAEPEGGFWLLY